AQTRFFDELHAHHHVVVEKLAGVFLVVADTTDDGRQVDDQVGTSIVEHAHNIALFSQVVRDFARNEHFHAGESAHFPGHKTAQKPGSAGHSYSLIRKRVC